MASAVRGECNSNDPMSEERGELKYSKREVEKLIECMNTVYMGKLTSRNKMPTTVN